MSSRTLHLPAGRRQQRRGNRARLPSPDRPFAVVIRSGERAGTWGRYSSEQQAERMAEALRRAGLAAVVERDQGAGS